MNLHEFMNTYDFKDLDVADAVGCHFSTISRIRRGKSVPTSTTYRLINNWAAEVAKKRRILKPNRLSWERIDRMVAE